MQAATADQLELLAILEEKHKQRARDDLNYFCKFIPVPGAPANDDNDCDVFYPEYVTPARHHTLINDLLMKVEAKEVDPKTGYQYKNVMMFMPPGSAKSTYGTVCFPSWYMGRNANKNIITTSYGSSLALKFGRKVRQVVKSPEYVELFPNARLSADNRAVENWSLTNDSTYMTGGILSGITGNRADGLLIDDPIKGKQDAESPTIRENVWEAYLTDLRTRVKPGGFKIIIQTRWHEDDLSGRILPANYDGESGWVLAKDGEPWFVLCLQAQCERDDDPLARRIGDWLWTDWFTHEHWEQEKESQGERNWSALYQQRPKPSEGSLIKRKWPKRYGAVPSAFSRIVLSLDTAYKPEQVNDPSVLGVWGELNIGHHLLEVWRERVEYPELKRVLASFAMKYSPDAILIEDKASGQSLIQECRENTNLPIIAIDTEGQNKLIRLLDISPQFESGRVWLPEAAPWLPEYESELFGFPLATHDDQVDMTSQYLKWAHRNSGIITSESTGSRRAALATGYQHSKDDFDNEDDDAVGVSSLNDFGGFL